jgi:hypothetical protein
VAEKVGSKTGDGKEGRRIKVRIVSNLGGGKVWTEEVQEGTTVKEVLDTQFGGAASVRDTSAVRIDAQDASDDTELRDGDTLTVSPTRVKGA